MIPIFIGPMRPINTEIEGVIGLMRPITQFRLLIRRKIMRLLGSLIHVMRLIEE